MLVRSFAMEPDTTSAAYQAGHQFGQTVLPILMSLMLLLVGAFFLLSLIKSFTRKTRGWIISAVVAGLITLVGLFGGIAFFVQKVAAKAKTAREAADRKKLITSADGTFSIEVPGNWKSMPELNDDAQIAAGNAIRDVYAMIIPNPRSDYDGSFEEFDELVLEVLVSSLEKSHASPVENLTIQGHSARRRRVEGTIEKTRVVYYLVTLETKDTYYQIMAWTMPSRELTMKPMLDEVINSFTVSGNVQPPKTKTAKKLSGSTEDKIRKLIADLLDLDPTTIKLESDFTKDLGADSLDTVELVMAIEEEFDLEVPDAEAMNMKTVGDVVRWIDQQPIK